MPLTRDDRSIITLYVFVLWLGLIGWSESCKTKQRFTDLERRVETLERAR